MLNLRIGSRSKLVGRHLTELALARPGIIILVTLLVSLACTAGLTNMSLAYGHHVYFDTDNPHIKRYDLVQETFSKSDNILFLVRAPNGQDVFTAESLNAIEWLTLKSWQLPYSGRVDSLSNFQHAQAFQDEIVVDNLAVNSIDMNKAQLERIRNIALGEPELVGRLISEDGQSTLVNVALTLPEGDHTIYPEADRAAAQLMKQFQHNFPELEIYKAGYVPLFNAFVDISMADMNFLMPLLLSVIVLFLWFFFRSWNAVSAITLTTLLSIGACMGLICWTGIPLNGTTATTPLIILTVAIANSVHLVSHFQQALYHGESRKEAVEASLKTNLLPITITALTTIIGFMSLNFSDVPPFRQLGNMASLGIFISMLLSLTFLPAVLLTGKADSCHKPRLGRSLARVAGLLAKHTKIIFLSIACAFAVLSLFATQNRYNDQFENFFDETLPFRQAMDAINQDIGGTTTTELTVRHRDGLDISHPEFLLEIERFGHWVYRQNHVEHLTLITDTIKRLNQTFHEGNPDYFRIPETRAEAAQLLLLYELSLPFGLDLNDRLDFTKTQTRIVMTLAPLDAHAQVALDQRILEHAEQFFPNLIVSSSSIALALSYVGEENGSSMVKGALLALALVSLLLMFAMRSVGLGFISLLPNLLPAAVAFGIWGIFVQNINIGVSAALGMTMGLIVDDTVHFLTRYQRARRDQSKPELAIQATVRSVGPALLITTLVLAAGFLVLAQSLFTLNAHVGYFTMLTICLALICDLSILPCTLLILERYQSRHLFKVSERELRNALADTEEDELIEVQEGEAFDLSLQNIEIYVQEMVALKSDSVQVKTSDQEPADRDGNDTTDAKCVEVFSRIKNPSQKVLFARNFMPQLELLRLSSNFDRLTIAKLLEALVSNPEKWRHVEMFSINVSKASMESGDFIPYLAATIKSHDFKPERFCLEVDNSVLGTSYETVRRFAVKSAAKGFKVTLCIRDLPAHASEWTSLINSSNDFPLDYLKLDARILQAALSNRHTGKAMERVKSSAYQAGILIITDRVDHRALKEVARISGAKYCQGYEISTPVAIQYALDT